MISKKYSLNNFNGNEYLSYMGLLIGDGAIFKSEYVDIEKFFLWLTTQFHDSRTAEGALCWIEKYGHLLSPSKLRRIVTLGAPCNQQVLNGIVNFMKNNKIKVNQVEILKTPKFKRILDFGQGVRIRSPMKEFEMENVLIPKYNLDKNKFLSDEKSLLSYNIEIRSRLLFGSCVNSDVFSIIKKHPNMTRYQIHKLTSHYKHSINKIFFGTLVASAFV